MIEIKGLIKKYKNNLILDIPYFKFKSGCSYMVIGSNGSGKSTLIKCMLGINNIDCGHIGINTKNVGYVPEKYYFPDFCSVNKFLKCILELYGLEINCLQIDHYCNIFNLDKYKSLNKLSKGMLQKTLIIQSLIHNSDLFIFDEPLNGLDTHSQLKFINIIEELKSKGKTIIITTHYPEFYQNKYDYTVRLSNRNLKYESN